MDGDTLFLLLAVCGAFTWWFKLQLDDYRRAEIALQKEEQEQRLKAERVRRILNR